MGCDLRRSAHALSGRLSLSIVHCQLSIRKRSFMKRFVIVLATLFAAVALHAAPIMLRVDATSAPANVYHAHLTIPVTAGPLTLYYPKWIPGEHGPTGPINGLTGLQFTANG